MKITSAKSGQFNEFLSERFTSSSLLSLHDLGHMWFRLLSKHWMKSGIGLAGGDCTWMVGSCWTPWSAGPAMPCNEVQGGHFKIIRHDRHVHGIGTQAWNKPILTNAPSDLFQHREIALLCIALHSIYYIAVSTLWEYRREYTEINIDKYHLTCEILWWISSESTWIPSSQGEGGEKAASSEAMTMMMLRFVVQSLPPPSGRIKVRKTAQHIAENRFA